MAQFNEGVRAAIYTRISRDAEGEQVGIERQKKDCMRLARDLDLTVLRVFSDNDTGASDRTRKSKLRVDYEAMIDAVRAGEIQHIVAYSNSRLTRRMRELEDLIQLHEKTLVQIHTVVSGTDDLSTADGRMVARIKASVDAGEADRISERTKAALRHKAMTGAPRVTSRRPFGWHADGKTLDPYEAALIREGVEALIRGVPLNSIRKAWTDQGVRSPAGSTQWHWSNVKQILTSYRAAGIRTYNGDVLHGDDGQPVQGQWEPIITPEQRTQALTQLRARKLTRRYEGKYLLSGMLRCREPECGRPLWGNVSSTKGRSTQYACSSSTRHVSIDAGRLERVVVLDLMARLTNRAAFGGSVRQEAPFSPWPGESRLQAVAQKIDELLTAHDRGELSGEVVFPRVGALERERDELRKERDDHAAAHATPGAGLGTAEGLGAYIADLFKMPVAELAAVLGREVETILIRKGVRGVASRDDDVFRDRIEIVWKSSESWERLTPDARASRYRTAHRQGD